MFPDIMFIVLAIAAFIYAALCLALFLGQRSFLYYPQAKSAADDNTLTLNIDGERVLVTTRPRPGSEAVIYFGGNAEDVSRSLPTLERAFPESSLYALNYRGYGGSTGRPTEPALIADALTLFDRVHIEHPHITIIGRSLGSGVAVHIADTNARLSAIEKNVAIIPTLSSDISKLQAASGTTTVQWQSDVTQKLDRLESDLLDFKYESTLRH
jgi:fermentation-respiration switch protein FrsA (DUF1100 family)